MVQARYTAKVLRDGGLAVLMGELAATNSLENTAMKVAAVICAIGAALSVLIRMPNVVAELNGYRAGIGGFVGSRAGILRGVTA